MLLAADAGTGCEFTAPTITEVDIKLIHSNKDINSLDIWLFIK